MRRRGWSLRQSADGIMDHSVRAHFRIESPPCRSPMAMCIQTSRVVPDATAYKLHLCACVRVLPEQRSNEAGAAAGRSGGDYPFMNITQLANGPSSHSRAHPRILSLAHAHSHIHTALPGQIITCTPPKCNPHTVAFRLNASDTDAFAFLASLPYCRIGPPTPFRPRKTVRTNTCWSRERRREREL